MLESEPGVDGLTPLMFAVRSRNFDEVTADAIALVYSPINSLARTTVPKGLRLSPECPMWIDSISINQGDMPERNQQVSLISEIYSKANSVAIWLGVEDEYAPAGLTALTSSWEERFGPWLSYTFVKSDCETHQEAIEIMKGHNFWTDQGLWNCGDWKLDGPHVVVADLGYPRTRAGQTC